MGSIIASGVGSGLDIEGLVTQLLAAEGQPQTQRLNRREAELQSKLSAFGQFRSAVATLQGALEPLTDIDRFRGRTVAVAAENLLAVTADSTAATGSYSVEVIRLAQAQKLASGPFATALTDIGSGELTVSVGGNAFTVTIDESAATLSDIASAINGAADNSGVTATLVTANDGVRLVLTGRETGAANAITVTQTGGDGGLAQIAYDPGNGIANLTQLTAAQDAQVAVDTFVYDSPDNTITEVVTGLTLDLKAAAPGSPTTVTVGNDSAGSGKLIDEFVKAYNGLVKSLRALTAYNADNGSGGPLLGDPTARNFLNSVRNEVVRAVNGNGAFTMLADLGITTEVDGSLVVDSARLGEALAAGFEDVGRLFTTAETGVATRLDALLARYVDDNGLIEARTEGLQARVEDVAKAREALEFRLQKVEERLRRQFSALDGLVAQLRNTSDFLTRQLDALLPTNQQSNQ